MSNIPDTLAIQISAQPALGPVMLQVSNPPAPDARLVHPPSPLPPPDRLLAHLVAIEQAIQALRADLTSRTTAGRLRRCWRWLRRR